MNVTSESPFPTREQELLLQAALLEGTEALKAFEEWKKSVDMEGYLDRGSFRLLPLLYKNLVRHSVKDEFMNRLKGVYRQSWYKNHKLFHESGKILKFLNEKGINTIVLKGVALTILAYRDFGVRPMADLDVLVPFPQARLTIGILKNAGWKPENDQYIEYNIRYGRSMMFTNEAGFELDLHWHPFFESHLSSSETDFWDHSVSLKLSEISTLSLCPADMLLHIIVHGVRWNKEPPIRWIADSITLINNCRDQLDWHRLLSQVKKYKVVLQFKDALKYLKINFETTIPEFAMEECNKLPVRFAERLVYHNSKVITDDEPDKLFSKLYQLFLTYLRQSNDTGLFRHLIGFIKYLRFRTKGKKHLRIIWYYISKRHLK